MPKAEAGTPKWIANQQKLKGLQKLRWYCQMCQKQCRDENGFKCHISSENHQRQLLVVADDPDSFLDEFSKEFEEQFMYLMRTRFGTKRVRANNVYQEYITDRHHTHMNATQWTTLTAFVKHLGRTGQCTVDLTERGWYITYIDRDPETIQREKRRARKDKQEKDDEERTMDFINKMVEKARAEGHEISEAQYTELLREDEEDRVSFAVRTPGPSKPALPGPKMINALKDSSDVEKDKKRALVKAGSKRKEGASALDEILAEEEMRREKKNRKDYWLHEGIIVKLVSKKLGSDLVGKKAVVRACDEFDATVKLLDTGEKVDVRQSQVETVIPGLGKPVLVVNGAYRGLRATLKSLEQESDSVTVVIEESALKGKIVTGVAYDDICKLLLD